MGGYFRFRTYTVVVTRVHNPPRLAVATPSCRHVPRTARSDRRADSAHGLRTAARYAPFLAQHPGDNREHSKHIIICARRHGQRRTDPDAQLDSRPPQHGGRGPLAGRGPAARRERDRLLRYVRGESWRVLC